MTGLHTARILFLVLLLAFAAGAALMPRRRI